MTDLIRTGQPLPELSAQTAEGQATTVQAHLGDRSTLVYFLHGAWCPVCVGQLHLLQRYLPRVQASGSDIVAVTGDDPETLTTFLTSAVPSLAYTVLSDPGHRAHRKIGGVGETVAVVADHRGTVRWFARWPDHHEEPDYDAMLQALSQAAG